MEILFQPICSRPTWRDSNYPVAGTQCPIDPFIPVDSNFHEDEFVICSTMKSLDLGDYGHD
jgi:hypothetical protein